MIMAASKRIEFARTSILFSALSAEAYANQFLAEYVQTRDAKALDRLPFPDKLLIAPRVAFGRTLLDRGREPMQTIDALYRLRTQLVHPRPRKVHVKEGSLFEQAGYDDYNPEVAARSLVGVATVVVELWRPAGEEVPAFPTATAIVDHRRELHGFGKSCRERLPKAPKRFGLPRLRKRETTDAVDISAPEIPRTTTDPAAETRYTGTDPRL
jgi:hypothetical protein